MKRMVGLPILLLALIMPAYAQDQSHPIERTGWICNSKCVNHETQPVSCDSKCTDKSGDIVFIDDQGKTTKISNPDAVKQHMGKKMKVKCHMENGEMMVDDLLRIYG